MGNNKRIYEMCRLIRSKKGKKSNQSMATDRNVSPLNVTWMAIEKCAQVHFYADDRTMFVRLFFFCMENIHILRIVCDINI